MRNLTSFFSVLVFMLLNVIINAQTLEVVDFGMYAEIKKNTQYREIIGHDEDGFYAIRSEGLQGKIKKGSKIWLEYFSALTMEQESVNEMILPSVGGIQTEFKKMFYIENKIILFTTADDESHGRIYLYVQYMNQNGTLKNRPKKVGEIPFTNNPQDDFEFILVENNTKIAVLYHNSFMVYNGEPFSYNIIDANLQSEISEKIELPLKERKFEIVRTKIGESGNIYMMAKALQESKRKSRSKTVKYDNILIVYDTKTQEFQTYNIKINKYIPTQVIFELNDKEEVVIMGLFSAKSTKVVGEFIGAFYQILDPRIQKFIPPPGPKDYFITLDKTFLLENSSGRNGETPDFYNNYILKDIIILDNNTMVLMAENYYETTQTFTNPQTKEENILTYHNYNDIIIFGVNKDGKMDFVRRIPKNQNSMDDNGYYSSYAVIKDMNKIKIFFNDHASNKTKDKPAEKTKQVKFRQEKPPKAVPFIVTIYIDGSFEKDYMFPGKDSKSPILPCMIYKMDERVITYAQKGKMFKFGGFIFE